MLGLASISPWDVLVKSSLESGFTVALPRLRPGLAEGGLSSSFVEVLATPHPWAELIAQV